MRFLILLLLLLPGKAAAADLQEQWRTTAASTAGHIGIAALVIETGEGAALNPDDHFPMQSVYKLPIAMAVMSEVDQDVLSLNQIVTVAEREMAPTGRHSPLRDRYPHGTAMTLNNLVRYSLVESDNTASDVLLKLVGGPERVTAFLRASGIEDMVVATGEDEMDGPRQYDTWATPAATVTLLAMLQRGPALTEPARKFLLALMHATRTGENRIRALLPSGTEVEDKTGSSGLTNGIAAATNDIGLITLPNGTHLALAIYLKDSPSPDAERDKLIAKMARQSWVYWSVARSGE